MAVMERQAQAADSGAGAVDAGIPEAPPEREMISDDSPHAGTQAK
jgi:hypothetical protein